PVVVRSSPANPQWRPLEHRRPGPPATSPSRACRTAWRSKPSSGPSTDTGQQMTDADTLRVMVEDEQEEFETLLRDLTAEQWATPSLCRGWSVRDVVVHIANHSHTTTRTRIGQLARARFSVARQMDVYRDRSTAELLDWLSSPAKLGGSANIRTQLSELVIHQQDV